MTFLMTTIERLCSRSSSIVSMNATLTTLPLGSLIVVGSEGASVAEFRGGAISGPDAGAGEVNVNSPRREL